MAESRSGGNDPETTQKVQKYEAFLNDRLKSDLKKALERRDSIYEEISEYTKLATMIETIKASKHAFEDGVLRTKTDLGCNFFCEAEVEDPNMICVSVGYGVYVQLTLDEALEFIQKKTPLLEMKTTELTVTISKIKAHIKLVLEGLRELQNLEFL